MSYRKKNPAIKFTLCPKIQFVFQWAFKDVIKIYFLSCQRDKVSDRTFSEIGVSKQRIRFDWLYFLFRVVKFHGWAIKRFNHMCTLYRIFRRRFWNIFSSFWRKIIKIYHKQAVRCCLIITIIVNFSEIHVLKGIYNLT